MPNETVMASKKEEKKLIEKPAEAVVAKAPEPPKEEKKADTPKAETKTAKAAPKSTSAARASMARQLIFKMTGQKPVTPSFSTMPHVPSGSIVVNNLIGGSKSIDGKGSVCPGYPRRRLTELYGPESCGKTSAALAAIVKCQQAGGLAMFLDFEHALQDAYAKKVGVDFDPNRLLYYKPDTLEEGIKMLYLGIRSGVDLAVVDSVASMVPKEEFEKKIDDPERVGSLAAPLTRNLKKLVIWLAKYPDPKEGEGTACIFINQTRAKIGGGGYGNDEDQTPGGKALKFFSSMRLRMTRIKTEVIKKRDTHTGKDVSIPYGAVTAIKVVKNKLDLKQGQEGLIFIRYGLGLDDLTSIIENGLRYKFVKKEGSSSYLTYGERRANGREAFRKLLLTDDKLVKELEIKVRDAMASTSVEVTEKEQENEDEKLLAEIQADLGDEAAFEAEIANEEEVVLGSDPDENS